MRRYDSRRLFLRVLGSIFLLIGSTAYADDLTLPAGVLRVCSDPNNMPFSNEKGEGFENKIAELFAGIGGFRIGFEGANKKLGKSPRTGGKLCFHSPERQAGFVKYFTIFHRKA